MYTPHTLNSIIGSFPENLSPIRYFARELAMSDIQADTKILILNRCLGEVPVRQAKAFLMREMDGLNTDESWKTLNISAFRFLSWQKHLKYAKIPEILNYFI